MTDLLNRPDIQMWLKELRDAANKQTRGTLREIDKDGNTIGYCCIGLYHAKVLGKEPKGIVRGMYDDKDIDDDEIEEGDPREYEAVEKALPQLSIYDKGITMNDNGHTFTEIADMIEKELTQNDV
jgi:hypothetical protein